MSGTGPQLLDESRRPIPVCNVTDTDTGAQYYIPDEKHYHDSKTKVTQSRLYTLVTSTLLILFSCIFSLNFNSTGWSAGNLLTFGIIVGIIYVVTQLGKNWKTHHTLFAELTRRGVPCVRHENNANIVYCKQLKR
jgi:lipopolysaccharide export LptBFGC system permease protein LptF